MAERIYDLSDLGAEREKVRLPDGKLYELLGPADVGPLLGAKIDRARKLMLAEGEVGELDDVAEAERQERFTREQAKLVCPSAPPELLDRVPFQVCAGIVGRFMQGVRGIEGMDRKVQDIFDELAPEQATEQETTGQPGST